MYREYPILEDMARSLRILLDLTRQSMVRAREEGVDESFPQADRTRAAEMPAESGGFESDPGSKRLAEFLAQAAREAEEGAQTPRAAPDRAAPRADLLRPSRTGCGPRGGSEEPGVTPPPDGAEPLPLTELPPEAYWFQALILPAEKWGAGPRQVARWLEAKTVAPAPPAGAKEA